MYSTDVLPPILQRVGVRDKRRRLQEDEILYNIWGDEIETEESLLAGLTEMERAALQNSYPDGAFTDNQIRNGASILYIIGKSVHTNNELFRNNVLLHGHFTSDNALYKPVYRYNQEKRHCKYFNIS